MINMFLQGSLEGGSIVIRDIMIENYAKLPVLETYIRVKKQIDAVWGTWDMWIKKGKKHYLP